MTNETTLSGLAALGIGAAATDEDLFLRRPRFRARLAIALQRTVDRALLIPFGGLLVSLMRRSAGYTIEDMAALRREFREITNDKRPLLICANHLTFIDSALLIWALGSNFRYTLSFRRFPWNLPAGDFFKKKLIFRVTAYLTKCIFIHRDGPKTHKNEILGICRHLLSRGEIVTIFPEGKRSRLGIFDREHITFGVGKLLAAVPDCRVLCVYLRGDKQETYSNYPPKGSRIRILTRLITPSTDQTGKDAYFSLANQVADHIKELEHAYFGGVPTARGFGKTALITGASEGIGRALAHELAADSHNLILVARNTERLESLARECEAKYGCRTRIARADLSRPEAVTALCEELRKDRVTVDTLVNNAGFGVLGVFEKTDLTSELELVQTQIGAMLQLTKWAMAGMSERGHGKILNVASIYSYMPVPQQSVYSASKAFMASFTESLAYEAGPKGIQVSLLCPGITRTEFRKRAGAHEKNGGSGVSPAAVARAGYRGLKRGTRIVVPGRINQIVVGIMRHFPGGTAAAIMGRVNRARGVNTP